MCVYTVCLSVCVCVSVCHSAVCERESDVMECVKEGGRETDLFSYMSGSHSSVMFCFYFMYCAVSVILNTNEFSVHVMHVNVYVWRVCGCVCAVIGDHIR